MILNMVNPVQFARLCMVEARRLAGRGARWKTSRGAMVVAAGIRARHPVSANSLLQASVTATFGAAVVAGIGREFP